MLDHRRRDEVIPSHILSAYPSVSCGALLRPTPAAVGEEGEPIGKPAARRRAVRLPRARASGKAEVARPPFSRFQAEACRRVKSVWRRKLLQSAGPLLSYVFPVVMQNGPTGPNWAENAENPNSAEAA